MSSTSATDMAHYMASRNTGQYTPDPALEKAHTDRLRRQAQSEENNKEKNKNKDNTINQINNIKSKVNDVTKNMPTAWKNRIKNNEANYDKIICLGKRLSAWEEHFDHMVRLEKSSRPAKQNDDDDDDDDDDNGDSGGDEGPFLRAGGIGSPSRAAKGYTLSMF